jgi:uncharacterized zinc-type alcohol dehydrogenase-like protein
MSVTRAIPIPEEAPKPETYTAKAYAAQSPTSGVAATTILRRKPLPKDVQIEILYCGICHTDLHFVRNDFENAIPTTCLAGKEQYCASMLVLTYNGPDKHVGGMTYGGYSQSVVVDEDFVLRVPPNLNLAAAAPLLCAGITTYSPLRHANVRAGQKLGVVGLGGLGHMGVKLAAAFGANVVVFTTSANKALMRSDLARMKL